VYFLKKKVDVLFIFKTFNIKVEKQIGKAIKVLKSNNGGELISIQFIKYCQDSGIRRQFSQAYTPQQNGVIERKNWTIVERARSILLENRLTLQGLWSGNKPYAGHFRIFGCATHTLVLDPSKKKFDSRTELCWLLGYDLHTKAYMLLNPRIKKVILNQDVRFDETHNQNGPLCCLDALMNSL
jgi:hypothetical protein